MTSLTLARGPKWRRARLLGGIGLFAIGLPGLRDDLKGWHAWLGAAYAYLFPQVTFLDVLFLLLGAGLLVSAVPWSRWRQFFRRDGTKTSRLQPAPGVEVLSPLSNDRILFIVDGNPKEVELEGFLYHEQATEADKAKIHQVLRSRSGVFTRRDFVAVVDKGLSIKLSLNDLIAEADRLANDLRFPGLPLSIVPDNRNQQVVEWEASAMAALHIHLPDHEAEFTRDVGDAPQGVDYLVHRVTSRIDRLARIKERLP